MKIRDCAALSALALLAAHPASAAIINISMTGYFTSGFDESGIFGTANTNLAGTAFTISETFDSTVGEYEAVGANQTYSGGPGFNPSPSPGTATLTVNGHDLNFSGTYFSYITVNTSTNLGRTSFLDRALTDGVFYETGLSTSYHSPSTLGITDGWDTDCSVTGLCTMSFAMTAYDNPLIPGPHNTYYNNLGKFDGVVTSVTPGVPEPATWAMMILGFGLVGATARRGRALSV